MEQDSKNFLLVDYLKILYSRRWLMLLVISVVTGITVYITFTSQPVYEAATTIMINISKPDVSMLDPTGYFNRDNLLSNECVILKSHSIAEMVYNRMRHQDDFDSLSIAKEESPVEALRERLNVMQLKRTDIIELKFRAPDPDEAALIVNIFAEVYKEQNVEFYRGEFSEVRKFLEKQLELVRQRLQESEGKLGTYKEQNEVTALTEEVQELVEQYATFEGYYNQAQTDLKVTEKRLDYLKAQLELRKETLVDDLTNDVSPYINQLKNELTQLQTEATTLQVKGAPENGPQLSGLRQKIGEAKEKLKTETAAILSRELTPDNPLRFSQDLLNQILNLEVERESQEARVATLGNVMEQYNQQLVDIPSKELELARLERDYKVNENTYMMMMTKYEEVRISEAGELGNLRIIDKAFPPEWPVMPKKKLNVLLGFIMGVSLAMGICFMLEYFDNSLKTIEDVEKSLHLPVLGSIPIISSALRRSKKSRRHGGSSKDDGNGSLKIISRLVTHLDPKSPISEAYKTLRTNIQFSMPDGKLRTIAITSPGPKEGKSTTASNLAITMAQMGSKTLLIDADLRKPIINSIFDKKREPGLTNLFMGNVTLDECVLGTPIENLYIIAAGTLPPNPSELLGSRRMQTLIADLKTEYDIIIFDTPPVIAVTDAAVLGNAMDAALLIIDSGNTNAEAAIRAATLLKKANSNIMGTVLNNINVERYFGTYDYYYYYHKYYHHEKREKKKKFADLNVMKTGMFTLPLML